MSFYSAWLMLSLLSTTANKDGRDVESIFASVGPRIHFNERDALAPGDVRVPPSTCEAVNEDEIDCTDVLRRILIQETGNETIVLLRPVRLPAQGQTCAVVEIHSLIRRAIWDNSRFEGLGFYLNGSESYIEKDQLLAQKDVFLIGNNEPALVHTFFDYGLCEPESTNYAFKAFAQFKGPGKNQTTRVWEIHRQNYELSSSLRGFDHTLDLIRP